MAYSSKEKRNAWAREWRRKNPERSRATSRAHYYRHLEKNRERGRHNTRFQNYGITREEYEWLVEEQRGLCAICSKKPTKLFVDHDHKTKKVRGLLCLNCNTFIGHAQENPEILTAALAYLLSRQ